MHVLETPVNVCFLLLIPRFVEGKIKLFKRTLAYADSMSCAYMYRDIFFKRLYAFESTSPEPVIVDLGANIGLSVVFLKRLYPRARITAVEADPHIFRFLERNAAAFGITNVRLINAAAHDCEARLGFYSEGADSGHLAEDAAASCQVQAIDTRALLEKEPVIDMLKMDIEGAEGRVLRHCAPALRRVRNMYIEYHGGACTFPLADVLRLLDEAGFDCQVQSLETPHAPLLEMRGASPRTSCAGQYHIFAVNRRQEAEG